METEKSFESLTEKLQDFLTSDGEISGYDIDDFFISASLNGKLSEAEKFAISYFQCARHKKIALTII